MQIWYMKYEKAYNKRYINTNNRKQQKQSIVQTADFDQLMPPREQ